MKKRNAIVALLVVISCMFLVFPLLAQTTITLQPGPVDGKDVNVHSMFPDLNNATHKAFRANAWTAQGTPFVVRAFVDFDLSIIPEGAEIISAFLSLYSYYDDHAGQLHSSLSGSNEAWLRKITTDWNEYDVTWRKQPEYETNGQVYLPQSTSPTQHYENIDVTNIISDLYHFPDEYFGLAFMLNNENYYRRMSFCTSDHHDPDRRPKLEITYIGSLPLADFSFEIDDLQADFISQVLNGDSFLWDFGDGVTSTDKNPVHIYSDYGDYDVTLVASNVFGADSVTKTVSLCELPVAAFEIEIDIRTIFLTNISSVADTYYWDFGDGYSSTLKDPVHTYLNDGVYEVSLISFNDCGTDTTIAIVEICELPSAQFNYEQIAGYEVSFENLSEEYETCVWDFGDGAGSSLNNPVHLFNESGIFYVKLIVSKPCGVDSILKSVTLHPLPVANFEFSTTDLRADFNNLSLFTEQCTWFFGDGNTSTEFAPDHQYEISGDYTVTLVAINIYGSDTTANVLAVCEMPMASFDFEIDDFTVHLTDLSEKSNSCLWDFGDGMLSNLENPDYTYIAEGEYLVTLISYNECGSDTTTTLISIPDNQWDDQAFILIYPNPTRGKVDIKIFAEDFIETDMVLFNEIGQVIKRIKLTEAFTNLDLSHLQAGVYVVKLTASNIYHRSVLIIF